MKIVSECAGLEIFADPLLIKVVYNLIDNALRHGGSVSTIRFLDEKSGDDLVLVAEDDGEGVRVQDKQKIFSKGFGKNTGFGLFLVREILAITGMSVAETGFPGKVHGSRLSCPGAISGSGIQNEIKRIFQRWRARKRDT